MYKKRYNFFSSQFQDPGKDFFSLLFIVFFMLAVIMTSFYHSLSKKIENPEKQSKGKGEHLQKNLIPENKRIYFKVINNKLYAVINNKKYLVEGKTDLSFLNNGIIKIKNKKYAAIYILKNTDIPIRTYQKIIDFFKSKNVKCEAFLEE